MIGPRVSQRTGLGVALAFVLLGAVAPTFAAPVPWTAQDEPASGVDDEPSQSLEAPAAPAPATPAPVTPAPVVPAPTTPVPVVPDEPVAPAAPPTVDPHADAPGELSSSDSIRAILALLIVFALAYVLGHPRVQRWERRLGVAQIVTAGFPFLLLGLVGRSEGVLSPQVLDTIGPLMPLGLGWVGFALGIRVDGRRFGHMPRLLFEAFLETTLIPLAAIMGAATIMLAIVDGITPDALFLRDALVLATAGIVTARPVLRLLEPRVSPDTITRIERLVQLDELLAVVVLILLSAFFRSEAHGGWSLPSAGWVFVTIGVGAALGVLVVAALGQIGSQAESAAVLLGSICLAAGAASSLHLSPLALCFLAGALVANLPGTQLERVRQVLDRLERPIHLLFLVLAGALWRPEAWEAWVLMALFVAARLVSRSFAFRFFARRCPDVIPPDAARVLATSPMGPLAMAIVMSAQELFSGPTVPWIVHAIIGGALATELALHLFRREREPAPAAPLEPEERAP